MERTAWILRLTILVLVFILENIPVEGFNIQRKMTCNSTQLNSDLNACTPFGEQPVHVYLPPSIKSKTTSSGEIVLPNTGVEYQQMLLQLDDYKCELKQRRRQEAQLDCRHAAITRCIQPAYRSYIPTSNRIKEAFKYLCDQLFDLRKHCSSPTDLDGLTSCVRTREPTEYTTDDEITDEDRMCSTFESAKKCLSELVTQCGETDDEVHMRFMDYLQPQFCGASVHTVSLTSVLLIAGLLAHVVNQAGF